MSSSNKRYTLDKNDTVKTGSGTIAYRICYHADESAGIEAFKGGYIESESNHPHDAKGYILGNAEVSGDAEVFGHAEVSGKALVYGNAIVSGHAVVSGNARIRDHAHVFGNAKVFGYAVVSGEKVSDTNKN